MLLIRTTQSTTATLGKIYLNGGVTIHTLERPWRAATGTMRTRPPCGEKGVSCVPPGVYQLVRHSTEAHPHTVALVNPDLWVYHFDDDVPLARKGFARTAVLIHPANYVSELRGCIAPGMTRSGETVQNSRQAFSLLMGALVSGENLEISAEGMARY